MELERLFAAIRPQEITNAAPTEVVDLAYDTRSVRPGTLFFCVRGSRFDGNELAPAAVEAGAVALVVERPLELPVPQVVVASVREAMPRAAAAFFGEPSHELEVAAVTGTNGKTTTAFLMDAILSAADRRPALLTNIVRRVGGEQRTTGLNTPEAIDLQRLFREMLRSGDRSCVMEATSIASAQGRLAGTRFAVLVFTNLTQDHLDFHRTMDEYFAAKRALFEQAERAVVNVGDEWGRRLAAELPHARTFRPDDPLDGFDLHLRGGFNRANALGAIWAARELGIDEGAIRAGVASLNGVPGRFEAVDAGQPFAVIVDYAHTPDSLDNVLRAARDLGSGRLIVVFGAGGDRDREKRPLMGEVARTRADRAIVTTDNPRTEDPAVIAAEVAAGKLEIVLDRRDAIAAALADAEAGDVVVIAGKGADTEMELADRNIPFSDEDVVRELLGVIPVELDVVEPLGRLIARPWADAVTGMQVDSRRIAEGDLFVAVGGGVDFVEHALARGAAAALVPEEPVQALAAVAGAVRARSKARFVGITGSTGKTSTKDILYAICAPHRRTVANEGNYNTEIGVPLTVCRVEEDTELVITEMGMRGPGQIAWLASFVRPDVGVITNIGPVHLEFLGSVENIARAKAELVGALPAGGIAIVPHEPLLEPYLQRQDLVVQYIDADATLPFATSFDAHHQLANARTAVAIARCLDVPLPEGTLTVDFTKHRNEERELPGGGLLLNDCYNANPLSMRAALEHLTRRAHGRRRVAVLGDMRELGPDGPGYHDDVARLLRELGVEYVISVGELARAYGGDEWVATAADAAERLPQVLRPGDIVLVKGSLAVGLAVVAENLPS